MYEATTCCCCPAAAVAKPDSGLLDCSPTHKSVPGDVLTALSHADDATASVTLPFPVDLLDAAYTTATVSTNGWVSFGTSGASEPCTIPTSWPGAPCLGTGPVLAVFWGEWHHCFCAEVSDVTGPSCDYLSVVSARMECRVVIRTAPVVAALRQLCMLLLL